VTRPARRQTNAAPRPAIRRAAVYVRVSTDEQAALEFNSLQAQEQICKTYISMRDADPASSERWTHSETYSDPGYSGGTLDRPALKRLMADIESGQINTLLVYKIDRLSRSIHQFYRIWEILEHYGVDLVAATQDLNTSTSQGKLMLNMLLSFGQFEREQISERTRDKIAAARKRGRWTGGMPILGYDVDPRGGRLVVNEGEAGMVREIFKLYGTTPSLTKIVEELGRRGWRRKTWTLRSGAVRNGATFTKLGLLNLLRNPLYIGKVPHRGTLYPGEHTAIIDEAIWARVQVQLSQNGTAGYQGERENSHALLKGLLYCAHCGCRMTPSHATKGNRRFRYYVCQTRLKKGAHECPTGRVAADKVERQAVEQVRAIGRDAPLIAGTVQQARTQLEERRALLKAEHRQLSRDLGRQKAAIKQLLAKPSQSGDSVGRLAEVQLKAQTIETRLAAIRYEIEAADAMDIDGNAVTQTLSQFDGVWDSLWPSERARIVGLLVEGIDYDGRNKEIAIRFQTDGLGRLAANGTA
jgi:site-specific DNA recombinase